MPIGIVDPLEIVQIEIDDAHIALLLDRSIEKFEKRARIGQICDRVGAREFRLTAPIGAYPLVRYRPIASG